MYFIINKKIKIYHLSSPTVEVVSKILSALTSVSNLPFPICKVVSNFFRLAYYRQILNRQDNVNKLVLSTICDCR